MNKEQAERLKNVLYQYRFNLGKIEEFNDKFFNAGCLLDESTDYHKTLRIALIHGNRSQDMEFDSTLYPLIVEFFKQLRGQYIKANEDIRLEDIIESLKFIEDTIKEVEDA